MEVERKGGGQRGRAWIHRSWPSTGAGESEEGVWRGGVRKRTRGFKVSMALLKVGEAAGQRQTAAPASACPVGGRKTIQAGEGIQGQQRLILWMQVESCHPAAALGGRQQGGGSADRGINRQSIARRLAQM